MKLDIVLQTCTTNTNQSGDRYCGADKLEISKRCFTSLIKSINFAKSNNPDLEIWLTIFDDQSDREFINFMIDNNKGVKYNIKHLPQVGIMKSILTCYEFGRTHGEELVYFAQDDYLFEETAIKEMVEGYYYFRYMLGGREVGIYPFNDPYRYYIPGNIELCRVVHGPGRHWRTCFFTASCFMINVNILKQHWDLFEAMGNCDAHDRRMEDKTINKLWQERELILFTPIPSLALHMQFESEKDPYIDWETLWRQNESI